MKKTLFQEPAEKPCDTSSQSNVSSSEAGVSYKASCSGAVDQYSNLLLKNENKRLEKDNKKLVSKLTQLEAELKRYKENPKKRYVNLVNDIFTLYCALQFPSYVNFLVVKVDFIHNEMFSFSLVKKRRKCPVLSRKNPLKVLILFSNFIIAYRNTC